MACLPALLLAILALGGCLAAAWFLYGRWQQIGNLDSLLVSGGDPDLSQTQRLYLQGYLAAHAAELRAPAGSPTGNGTVLVRVEPGETAGSIAAQLASLGLLNDRELFLNYLTFYGLDSRLGSGEFSLSPQLSIPDLAAELASGGTTDLGLRFLAGWRLEEMANYLAVTRPAQIDAGEFLALAKREAPLNLNKYGFLATLPAGASLEGYLLPDSYVVPTDADAADLVDLMLLNFGTQVTPSLRQALGVQGLSLHQGVTLASIVQREAVLVEERPLIAGVFANRLRLGIPLQADATVQYALGRQEGSEGWWKSPLAQSDLQVESAYNTYLVGGLPPGPIGSVSLSALEAVARPRPSDYLYFVADCLPDSPGAHAFSVSYEEHLAQIRRCQ